MSDELPAVTLARIEGKLDLLNAAIATAQIRGDDHEARLRVLESKPDVDPDHEARLRTLEAKVIEPERVAALEARPVGITPAKFLTTLVGIGSLAAAAASLVTLLSR